MRTRYAALLVFGLILTATDPGRADDAAAARALVDKAIQAQGGEAKLAKVPASSAKLKGTYHGMGQAVAFTGEFASQGPTQQRLLIEFELGGEKFRLLSVLNGDKGWNKLNDDTEEMDKEELAEAQEDAYEDWVSTLLPLKDKAFTLTPLGEIKVDKRPAAGVKVSRKDHRDINLYFDKETGLLVKTESRVKDDETGKEVPQESLLSDYKEVQGTRQAMKMIIKRDGKPYLESEYTELKLAEKLDAKLFDKP